MERYLGHTDYPIWKIIQKGNGPVHVSIDTNVKIRVLPPKTAEEILARERERKARTTLVMSIPEDHLAKFHKMTDAKEMWEAIKSRFGGNDESKKMQKYILKQQFKSFSVSPLKMPIRSFLGLYLLPGPKVFESDVKGSTASSSNTQNVTFVSSKSTSNHEDLEHVDEFDLEEMYMKWQVAMISMRLKKFYKNTGRKLQFDAKEPTGFDKTKEEPKALVIIDGDGVDWIDHAKDEQDNFALMAYSNSGSNTKMSPKDKSGLGYGDQIHEGDLSYENEVLKSVFNSRYSDVEDSPVYDRFAKVEGIHAVPPPMIGIYMPPKSNFGIDDVETLEYVPKPAVNEPKAVSKPKVWSDAPIIEEYESDSDDEYQTVKEQNICSPSPKADKRDYNGFMSKKLGLGYSFTKKACFVCGSFSHLIRDYDFHEKRMAKHVELNKHKGKGTSQGKNRPVWNNVQRLNHQNKFVLKTVLTKTGKFLVNAARQNLSSQAAATNDPQKALKNKGIVDSRCSRHMTGNKAYLVEYQDYNGGPVAFGGSTGQITGKGKIITRKLDDKKNKVLFTDSECLVLSPNFKLPDENQVLLRVPRQNNMNSFNLENIVPTGGLACLIAKATIDESNKWHRRLGHVNFKTLNKLVKGNLVRGLPLKIFQNDHTCVACQKEKQHKATCKANVVSSISQPLHILHMDFVYPKPRSIPYVV
ncbi:putative ribonuclease H-like domain-containing protein [Tanacetum coccineum]